GSRGTSGRTSRWRRTPGTSAGTGLLEGSRRSPWSRTTRQPPPRAGRATARRRRSRTARESAASGRSSRRLQPGPAAGSPERQTDQPQHQERQDDRQARRARPVIGGEHFLVDLLTYHARAPATHEGGRDKRAHPHAADEQGAGEEPGHAPRQDAAREQLAPA